jgi:hypothetical protein
MTEADREQTPFRLGFRVCDRRYPFLWETPGQCAGRWNRAGDQPVHYLASTPLVAWVEWLRHQEIEMQEDLAGISASLWAVLIPAAWGPDDLPAVELPLEVVLGTTPEHQRTRLALVDQLKQRGAHGLKAPTAALQGSEATTPCSRVSRGNEGHDLLPNPAEVLLLWCPANHLVGWCCVPAGRPAPELLPLVRREGRLPG